MQNAVLVLNANYQPLQVTNIHRAVNLILAERAFLVMNGRGMIRSVTREFPIPSIIRLAGMIHCPHFQINLSNAAIFQRDVYTCQYCGTNLGSMTVDHVIPRHLGGQHVWENVVTACPACNHRKGGKLLEEVHMQLLKHPKAPPVTAVYRFSHFLPNNLEWYPYLESW